MATVRHGGGERPVLAFNSGSSSLKFGWYRATAAAATCLLQGEAEALGGASATLHAEDGRAQRLMGESLPGAGPREAMLRIVKLLSERGLPAPQAIGHRVVHGGPALRRHCRIDADVLEKLEAATPFAPLHTPAALAVIRLAEAHFPGVPQVACFDTSFHSTMPDIARTLPLPRALRDQGIQRYGFHGLSCESIVQQLAAALPPRLLIAHLGNGASVTAVRDGESIDTSMGLTPSGGLIMGTRSGDLDPGVLVYLLREWEMNATALEDLVDRRGGLFGISGVGGDMRALHAAAAGNADARLAVDMFCATAAKALAAMSTVLGAVDLIVFTGGIGENDARVRAEICCRLACIGVTLDGERNRTAEPRRISADASRCSVRVLPSQEDLQIARHACKLG